MSELEKRKVLSVVKESEGIFSLYLERSGISFLPGDCLALYDEDGEQSRPYSIASGVDEDVLRFVIRKMPNGIVSSFLSNRTAGDEVQVSPPFGWFRPGDPALSEKNVFLATGTGISPFLAHKASRPENPPLLLLYGARTYEDAIAASEWGSYCPTRVALSREKHDEHHNGRITDLLSELPLTGEIHYFLCGLDAMIDETSRFLEERGVALKQIHRECFFNA